MRLPRLDRLTLLTAALVVLLPALAVLQYRWVGQLSEAERERMQRNVLHASGQFREAFDGELARAFIGLQVDGALLRDEAWERYAARHAAWVGTAEHPGLVSNVYLIDADHGVLRLRRWDAPGRRFEAAGWTGALAPARAHFQTALQAFAAGPRERRPPASFEHGEALLVAPLVHMEVSGPGPHRISIAPIDAFGFTAIELDMEYIRQQLVPALAKRHFTHSDGAGYRVAVVDAADPGRVIYRSSPEAPTDPSRADAAEPFFGAHGDPLMVLAARREMRAQARERSLRRNLFVSVFREGADGAPFQTRILDGSGGRWRLLVQDDRGSLEAAVAGVRRRNLLISFGILLLMGVSIALLSASSRRAERLARQQMEFVAGVSHELRTPVAVIRSAAENMAHGVVGDAERIRRYGDAIGTEARRLGEMVERVLQLAGIESGQPRPVEAVAVGPLIDEAVDLALGGGRARTVEREIEPHLPPVAGDAATLRSAIQNLVANAAKYGGPDGWIGVRAVAHGTGRAREVRITVSDHGPGVAARDLPHIFEPFYRGAAELARQAQGTGLGLALVRRIAEAHGGRVSVVTHEGEGSAFTIHLPAAPADAPHAIQAAAAQAPLSR